MAKRDPEPRLLTQGQAAAYCGVCVAVFKKACPVQPVSLIERIPRYDRHALDRWIDGMSNLLPVDPQNNLVAVWDDAGNVGARKRH